MALSSFQGTRGRSCLKENPSDCRVFNAEWQPATSLLLLTDPRAASLLCATHHAVTNIIQQKKIPSKVTTFSSLTDLVEAPLTRCCFLSRERGESKGQKHPGKLTSHLGWSLLDPTPSQLPEWSWVCSH